MRRALSIFALLFAAGAATAEPVFFDVPSDDRWHYPFNFSSGFRGTASAFGSVGNEVSPEFNDRDGIVLIAWDTSGEVMTGLEPFEYDVCSATIVLTGVQGSEWIVDRTLDEWFTNDLNDDGVINADGVPRGSPNDSDGESDDVDAGRPLELFGVGFGPLYAYETWNQSNAYQGGECTFDASVCTNAPRDPFPFVFQDGTGEMLHVEDNVKGLHNEDLNVPLCNDPQDICPFTPVPWAIGDPIDYTPRQQTVPFSVRFDVDLSLSGGDVLGYVKEQLSGGRVFVSVTSMVLVPEQSTDPDFPSFLMKEASLELAPKLILHFVPEVPGDYDGDGFVTLSDFAAVLPCFAGPGGSPDPELPLSAGACACTFDGDGDGDIDLRDLAVLSELLQE